VKEEPAGTCETSIALVFFASY